jgi:hypothetical protein
MAKRKRPPPGKCVHCLKDPVERNWDHVFPTSWYPDVTSPSLEKWKMPSCVPCNENYGKLEEDFLRRVALCIDPHLPTTRSVVEKALRSMRPSAATNDADRRVRLSLGQRILREALHGTQIPQTGIYPRLGERWQRPTEDQTAILVPVESFRRLTEKIVRGTFYVDDGKFVEPPYEIEFFALDDDGARPIRTALSRFGKVYAREPGLVVKRAVAVEDGISSLFEIEFWGQFTTFASVQNAMATAE